MELKLKPITAYTVYSSDSDVSGSEKGVYKSYDIALAKSYKAGWYGGNGEVRDLKDIWEDDDGNLYRVKSLGKFTDEAAKYRLELIESIQSKLTTEELNLIEIKGK